MRTATKAVPPILLCLLMKVNVGVTSVDVEPCYKCIHSCHLWNEEQLNKLIHMNHMGNVFPYDRGTVYGAECQLQCVGSGGGDVGILQNLQQVDPTNAQSGTGRTPVCMFDMTYQTDMRLI